MMEETQPIILSTIIAETETEGVKETTYTTNLTTPEEMQQAIKDIFNNIIVTTIENSKDYSLDNQSPHLDFSNWYGTFSIFYKNNEHVYIFPRGDKTQYCIDMCNLAKEYIKAIKEDSNLDLIEAYDTSYLVAKDVSKFIHAFIGGFDAQNFIGLGFPELARFINDDSFKIINDISKQHIPSHKELVQDVLFRDLKEHNIQYERYLEDLILSFSTPSTEQSSAIIGAQDAVENPEQ